MKVGGNPAVGLLGVRLAIGNAGGGKVGPPFVVGDGREDPRVGEDRFGLDPPQLLYELGSHRHEIDPLPLIVLDAHDRLIEVDVGPLEAAEFTISQTGKKRGEVPSATAGRVRGDQEPIDLVVGQWATNEASILVLIRDRNRSQRIGDDAVVLREPIREGHDLLPVKIPRSGRTTRLRDAVEEGLDPFDGQVRECRYGFSELLENRSFLEQMSRCKMLDVLQVGRNVGSKRFTRVRGNRFGAGIDDTFTTQGGIRYELRQDPFGRRSLGRARRLLATPSRVIEESGDPRRSLLAPQQRALSVTSPSRHVRPPS